MSSPTTDDSQRPAIAAAVITREGEVLLVRRRVAEGRLSWQFPAGEIETGESPEVAAVREAHEETGLSVAPLKLLGKRVHPTTGRTVFYVACEVTEGDAAVVDDEELAEIAWSTLSRLPGYVPYGLYDAVQLHLNSALAP